MQQLDEANSAHRIRGGGLDDDRVAHDQRRRHLMGKQINWIVERNNADDDPERLAIGQENIVFHSLVGAQGHRVAVEMKRFFRISAEQRNDRTDLAFGFTDGFSHLAAGQGADFLSETLRAVCEGGKNSCPFVERRRRPLLETLSRVIESLFNIRWRRDRYGVDQFSGRRIHYVNRCSVRSVFLHTANYHFHNILLVFIELFGQKSLTLTFYGETENRGTPRSARPARLPAIANRGRHPSGSVRSGSRPSKQGPARRRRSFPHRRSGWRRRLPPPRWRPY